MTRNELNLQLSDIEKRYADKEIVTPEGTLHIYYIFKAGQIGWENYFDNFKYTKKNFERAKEYLLDSFGYCGRDSRLTAIKKCYLESDDEKNDFKYSTDIKQEFGKDCFVSNGEPYPLCKGNGNEKCQDCCQYEDYELYHSPY